MKGENFLSGSPKKRTFPGKMFRLINVLNFSYILSMLLKNQKLDGTWVKNLQRNGQKGVPEKVHDKNQD